MVEDDRSRKARVLLVDEHGHLLLFRGIESALTTPAPWWFPPGGGLNRGESFAQAARRELREETGLDIDDPGPIVARFDVGFARGNRTTDVHEAFFIVQTERFEISTDGWTESEHEYVIGHHWWNRDELRASSHVFYPDGFVAMVDAHLPPTLRSQGP